MTILIGGHDRKFSRTIYIYSIFTLSPELSRFKSTNNKSQLYHTDIHVQVLIAFNCYFVDINKRAIS